jgi:hypothetical protein
MRSAESRGADEQVRLIKTVVCRHAGFFRVTRMASSI